ncbi:MAG: universal stress protein [Lacisediminihabitans sp.]
MADVARVTTVLVAVNDSPAAFAAAEVAVAYAARLGAQLRVVTIVDPTPVPGRAGQAFGAALAGQLESEAAAILNHVAALAARSGVEATTGQRTGTVASEILNEAREVAATLIVMASVDRPGHAIPKVGSHTLRVLEFASVPVLVVPGSAVPARP